MFRKWFMPTQADRLVEELAANEQLLQQLRVGVETRRHELRVAESAVLMYEERVARQRDEVLVLQHQEQCATDLKRVVRLHRVDNQGDSHAKSG